jgi:hypothetical protein
VEYWYASYEPHLDGHGTIRWSRSIQGVKALDEIVHARLAFTADDRRAGIAPVPVRYDTGTYTVTRANVDLFLDRKGRT